MKALVVGAGAQGGPCASILSRDAETTGVVLADIDSGMLKQVEQRIGSSKISTIKADASKVNEIAAAGRGCDLVLDFMPPWLALNVMKAALEIGANYVNTAFDQPFWTQQVAGEPLELDADFKKSNLTALLGCGVTPGLLNVMVRHYTDRLDTVNSIRLRVGGRNINQGPYDHMFKPWNPGWSPKQALIDCAEPPHVFSKANYSQLEPYSELEDWEFPEPIGKILVSHHSHEEVYSLPRTIGKGITYCDFKYEVSYQPAVLVTLGLASREPLELNGVKVKPIDLVTKLLPRPGNMFIEETEQEADEASKDSYFSMMFCIEGEKNGSRVEYKVNCPKFDNSGAELFNLFGTAVVYVALPAVIGGQMISSGGPRGIIFPEQLDPNKFLGGLRRLGVNFNWEEL